MRLVVSIQDSALRARLGGFGERLTRFLEQALDRFSVKLQARVKEKLTDDVLHVRTGTLRRSINREVNRVADGVEAIVGTNVEYAGVHEYGFHGEVTVREHLRRITAARKTPFAFDKARIVSTMPFEELGPNRRRTRYITGISTVRQHVRMMDMPERSFLRSSLAELQAQAVEEIQNAAVRALRQP